MKKRMLLMLMLGTALAASEVKTTQDDVDFPKFSKFKEAGLVYGSSVLPTLLENTKIQRNMNSETLQKGCDFIVSFLTQGEQTTSTWKKEMSEGCALGYMSYETSGGAVVVDSDKIHFIGEKK